MVLRVTLKGIESNGKTAEEYIRIVKNVFGPWADEKGLRVLKDITSEVIRDFEKYLEEQEYSPSTIHTYLAPICKAAKIHMGEINKPKRASSKNTRGRGGEKGERGRIEAEKPENERICNAAKAIGIRKAEYRRLKGADLVRGKDGYLYVHVDKGKGGKEQLQRILPSHEETVKALFDGIPPEKRVFSLAEIKRADKINLHGIRADVAKEAYVYYEKRLSSEVGYREELKAQLLERYEQFNINTKEKDGDPFGKKSNERALERFMSGMDSKPIKTRGDNRRRCIEKGYPTEYDRLAVLAVSVFHLSHWRNDVTITNYLTA